MISAEDMAHIAAEVARGMSKDDSVYANLSPEHGEWFDAEQISQNVLRESGIMPMIAHEAVAPLLNQGFEDVVDEATAATPSDEPMTVPEGEPPASDEIESAEAPA